MSEEIGRHWYYRHRERLLHAQDAVLFMIRPCSPLSSDKFKFIVGPSKRRIVDAAKRYGVDRTFLGIMGSGDRYWNIGGLYLKVYFKTGSTDIKQRHQFLDWLADQSKVVEKNPYSH